MAQITRVVNSGEAVGRIAPTVPSEMGASLAVGQTFEEIGIFDKILPLSSCTLLCHGEKKTLYFIA